MIKIQEVYLESQKLYGGGIIGVSVPATAIVVKKMLDSKQDNSNENNEDSERNKEVEKDLDDQKEKADNQDSKDEVKNPDSKSILLPLFIVPPGVVAIAVVVGIIVYFVCKGKRKNISLQHQKTSSDTFQHQKTINTFTNEESNNVNEFEVKKLDTLTNEESNNVNEFEVKKLDTFTNEGSNNVNEFEVKKLDTFTNEESNNVNESSFVSESKNEFSVNEPESESEVKKLESELKLESDSKLEPEVGKKVEELYKRLESINVDVSNVWTLEKLKRIFERSSDLVLETLLEKGNEELKTLWFCDENAENEENMKILFNFESVFKKFFEGDLKSEKKELFSLLINTERPYLSRLLDLFYVLNKNGFDKIDLTTEIAKILLKDPNFTLRLTNEREHNGRIIDFTAAILTGKYKEGQTSFEVKDLRIKKDGEFINFSYTFGNSPVDNLNALLSVYEKVNDDDLCVRLLVEVAFKYKLWDPKQQQQEYLNENTYSYIFGVY